MFFLLCSGCISKYIYGITSSGSPHFGNYDSGHDLVPLACLRTLRVSWRGPLKGTLVSECTVLGDLLTGFSFKFEVLKVKFLSSKSRIFFCHCRWAHAPAREPHASFSRYLVIVMNHILFYHSVATKCIGVFLFPSVFVCSFSYSFHSFLLMSRIQFHKLYA